MTSSSTDARPQVREYAYDHFWTFTSERQQIFERRLLGLPGPWTRDPILARFKFCNVYRAADRVSQHLIHDVAYRPDAGAVADRIFQIVAYRHFSSIRTWVDVCQLLGHAPTLEDLASDAFEDALSATRHHNGRLYTGAFILCATDAYGRSVKHLNHVELFRHMFLRSDLVEKVRTAPTLAAVFDTLKSFPLMGNFMSYQIAIDLNYSEVINFSEDDFTQPGPGALRGLRKTFLSPGGLSPSELVMWLVDRQEDEFTSRNLPFAGLFGRRLHAIDVQNLLCEVDKYLRVAAPELASARTKIKATFRPNPDPIELFFPPKWRLRTTAGRASPNSGPFGQEQMAVV
ncbi:hypothetical protein GCM10025783_05720 [Amnibacterium soli]|uniref:5-hmdU DNA kinase helical domain-containing protein n=1 Tax=Amnibacterium soli TaxID=1282736 RepID=A0ABP8YRX7_9MICO